MFDNFVNKRFFFKGKETDEKYDKKKLKDLTICYINQLKKLYTLTKMDTGLSNRSLQTIIQILTRKGIITVEEQATLFEINVKLARLGLVIQKDNDRHDNHQCNSNDSYPTWKSLYEEIFTPVIARLGLDMCTCTYMLAYLLYFISFIHSFIMCIEYS